MKKKRIPMIVLGILLIFGLIWWAGIDETIRLVRSADINYLLIALVMQLLATLAWALRWRVFLKKAGVEIGFGQIITATFIGVFFNNITPGARAGGEPARMVVISKKAKSKSGYGQVFATIMADRILDVIPVMVFTFIAFKYALSLKIHILLLVLSISTVSLMIILTVSILLSFNEKLAMKFLKWIIGILKRVFPKKFEGIEEKLEEKLKKSIFEFRETLMELSKDKAVLIKTLFYSFALWGFMILRTYFVFESIGYPLELYKILMVQMAGIALGMISILPGGIGITETVNSALYLSLSINKSLAVTATVIDRFISFWLPSIVGGALSIYLGVKSGGIKEKS
ncbi:MAG: flippase-like domain-containing protein [Thermococcus sp.]|uniref:lysylphosphatidylglycerol synthase transmembrane domain-containing protein n=1 Tax=Thermococcus sp. TaxID=35749 RepID=UPI001D50A53F|nr:flippase-like domain-containing protein [Thermococcus sp.]MBO8173965.1 flippase-like domain-containing protein [Thermococcus sp.]